MLNNTSPMNEFEIDLFLESVFLKYGYDFRSYAKASLRRRIQNLLNKTDLDYVGELIPLVLYKPDFIDNIINEFSITVSEMFRVPEFFVSLKEKVFTYLDTYPQIKVWHAGCATGEEVYSLAIMLKEEGLLHKCTIFATDINNVAISKAKSAIYSSKNIQKYTKNYQLAQGCNSFSDYYHSDYSSAILKHDLQKNITFAHHNLVTDGVFGEMHLILCRNVLIYFDKSLQNKVLNLFEASLMNRGFLALGSKETIQFSDIYETFETIDRKYKIYRKDSSK